MVHQLPPVGLGDSIRKRQFNIVYQGGVSRANKLLVMKALSNGLAMTRYGFAVGKRLGKATVRNRLRRRLREGLRGAQVEPGWDLIFVARSPASAADFHQLRSATHDLLAQAHLLKENQSK